MCQSRTSTWIPYGNQANRDAYVDKCLAKKIVKLNESGIPTLASCCGHKKYKKSVVVLHKDKKTRIEHFSKKVIPRKRRFYKKDKGGYYYIPELENKRK